MEIPHQLIQQIKEGNVILFLGAGASYGAKNSKGDLIPGGEALSIMLANKYLGDSLAENEKKSLAYISELCISESSQYEVEKYISDLFVEFEPEPFHLMIPTFPWKAIFTTNYDLIIEKAYKRIASALQELKPLSKNTPAQQIFTSSKVLPYYKIHGCINEINDPEAPLILTPDQFTNHRSKRDRLFNKLQELCFDYPVVYVGFGMSDIDIRSILNQLDARSTTRTRSYMVGPGLKELDQRLWENKKITTIKLTFANFLTQLNEKIDFRQRILGAVRPRLKYPIYDHFNINIENLKPSEDFESFIQNDIEYVHSNLQSPNIEPKAFYSGYFDNWDPILRNLDANRVIKDAILFEVFDDAKHFAEGITFYLLKGNAGSGKSVLLKRLAFDAGTILKRLCIFLKPDGRINSDNIIELFNYTKERIYLFIDNVSLIEPEVIYLIKKCKKEKIKLSIIGAERINIWNVECEDLSYYLTESYHLKYLTNTEISELLVLLDRYSCLGVLKSKTQQERVNAFAERAGRELLVALYEATNGKPFEEIILDEYKSINDVRAQSLYLTVSIFHRLGAEARAGLISRVHNIGFHEFKEKLFRPLEFIVFDRRNPRIDDYVYLTRNKSIAEIIYEKVLTTPQDRFDEFVRILRSINIDYESDRIAFLSITNAKKLLAVFPDPQMIRLLYKIAEEECGNDPKLSQQQAIFEMTSSGGSLYTAERHLEDALYNNRNDSYILHTKAELAYRRAEKSKLNTEFFSYIEEVITICDSIIKKSLYNSHAYHTSLKAYILKLRKVLDANDVPAIERVIKDIEKVLVVTKQLFPKEEFILEAESSFKEIIQEKENALELLKKAFDVNKACPYIALRLASFYDKTDNQKGAIDVLKEAVNLSSNDKDLNFRYAMQLQKEALPNYEDILYYLKRAFTKGDSRYQAQFWYARALYIMNKYSSAKEIFQFLGSADILPETKNEPSGLLTINGNPQSFTGTIVKLEPFYGFVKRDQTADDIFFYCQENEQHWKSLEKNIRVSFKMAFNYRGPIALDMLILP